MGALEKFLHGDPVETRTPVTYKNLGCQGAQTKLRAPSVSYTHLTLPTILRV